MGLVNGPVDGGGADPGLEDWLTVDGSGGVELADLEWTELISLDGWFDGNG